MADRIETWNGHCGTCGDVAFQRQVQVTNHILHLLLSLFLCGLWLPIWIILSIVNSTPPPFRCSRCGQTMGGGGGSHSKAIGHSSDDVYVPSDRRDPLNVTFDSVDSTQTTSVLQDRRERKREKWRRLQSHVQNIPDAIAAWASDVAGDNAALYWVILFLVGFLIMTILCIPLFIGWQVFTAFS